MSKHFLFGENSTLVEVEIYALSNLLFLDVYGTTSVKLFGFVFNKKIIEIKNKKRRGEAEKIFFSPLDSCLF